MLFTLTCEGPDATDLSWLLRKRPDRAQTFDLPYGRAYVFFPEYSPEKCSVCLAIDVDAESLNKIRENRDGEFQFVDPLQYINSSLLSGAIDKVFSSALRGAPGERPGLENKIYSFKAEIANFSIRSRQNSLAKILAPLGVEYDFELLGEDGVAVGDLRLRARSTLRDLLSQIYILATTFDRGARFWIGDEQLEKFCRHSRGWLENHPEKRRIIDKYFRRAGELKFRALERFDALRAPDEDRAKTLKELRREAVAEVLLANKATSVIDLGCGDGSMLAFLADELSDARLGGLDASPKAIRDAAKKLLKPGARALAENDLFVGSLLYRDKRIARWDAAILSEVIEHFEPERAELVMANILGYARPRLLAVTTHNKTYNALYPFLEIEAARHPDHRREFAEQEFVEFCQKFAASFDYEFESGGVGEFWAGFGQPTLLGVFKRC